MGFQKDWVRFLFCRFHEDFKKSVIVTKVTTGDLERKPSVIKSMYLIPEGMVT